MDMIAARMERDKCEIIIRNELSKINYDTKVYKKVISFIVATVIFGAVWAWCSSSPESNIYMLIGNKVTRHVIFFIPLILYYIVGLSIIKSAVNIKKTTTMEYNMSQINLNKELEAYVLNKLNIDPTQSLSDKTKIFNDYYKNGKSITIYENEFAKYFSSERFKPYIAYVSIEFWNYLARMVLLTAVLEGWMKEEGKYEYKFSTKDNDHFRTMVHTHHVFSHNDAA